jgi:hypothetical protein
MVFRYFINQFDIIQQIQQILVPPPIGKAFSLLVSFKNLSGMNSSVFSKNSGDLWINSWWIKIFVLASNCFSPTILSSVDIRDVNGTSGNTRVDSRQGM